MNINERGTLEKWEWKMLRKIYEGINIKLKNN